MNRFPGLAAAVSALVLVSTIAFAQTSGGAGGSPSAGSAGAGSAATSGVPSGPASPGGTGNVGNDPSGQGNAARLSPPPAPGVNSLGTAQSSGSSVTTGSSASKPAPGGVDVTGPNAAGLGSTINGDQAIEKENKLLDKKMKSICKGC